MNKLNKIIEPAQTPKGFVIKAANIPKYPPFPLNIISISPNKLKTITKNPVIVNQDLK